MSVVKLREALKHKELTFGTRETLRNLKLGKVKIVILAKDCQESTKKAVLYYSSLKKIDIIPMEQDSKEIAQLCKKNYPVSILSY
jgi:large subunit ribosomal protein L30e